MLALRLLLCFLLPPLAVIDIGCLSFFVVLVVTFVSWPIATIIALIVCIFNRQERMHSFDA